MDNNGERMTIPAGMRDWLPLEAKQKREITGTLLKLFSRWGYEEVVTPTLEYYDVLKRGETGPGSDQLYKLIDRDGSILVLRPEMTTPIARLMGSRIPGYPPWRLMYGGHVFRYEDVQAGRQREFNQVGVELIGQAGPEADCEVLALAIDALLAAGLQEFTVSLGHMGVLQGLLESLSLSEEDLERARHLILEKDFVGLTSFFERAGLNSSQADGYVMLLTQPFSPQKVREIDSAGIKAALKECATVVGQLAAYGYDKYVQVDLSTLRRQTYYTGMVFEIYTSGIGYPIGGGGRYDRLLKRFGRDYPATGFALGVERLLLSLNERADSEETYLIVGDGSGPDREKIIKTAQKLRSEGKRAIAELRKISEAEAQLQAQEKKAELIRVR